MRILATITLNFAYVSVRNLNNIDFVNLLYNIFLKLINSQPDDTLNIKINTMRRRALTPAASPLLIRSKQPIKGLR